MAYEYQKNLGINGKTYSLIRAQRGGSAIYKADRVFLRIGQTEKIKEDLALHRKMEKAGFPVAGIIEEGENKGLYYFIEESLGNNCFGRIFKRETEEFGHVSGGSFGKFLQVAFKFAEAQLKTVIRDKPWVNFEQGIHLDILCKELPDEKEKIFKKFERVKEKLDVFPFGVLHGDFTPFNIFPKGVIDLEDSFTGPVGFDAGAFMILQNWFPDVSDDEFYKVYKLTGEQRAEYLAGADKIYQKQGYPKISEYLEEFNFVKGVWFAVRMHHLPSLQEFRYKLIKDLVSS